MIGVFAFGYGIATVRQDLQLPMALESQYGNTVQNFETLFELGSRAETVAVVVIQNVRVLLAGLILGVFTFGVMSIFFAVVPFGIMGFFLGQPIVAVLGTGTFFAAIVPHSVVEIPAIVIATAAAVRLGSIVTRPPEGMGVWDAWLTALADSIKVFIAVVIPLLIIAALLEVYLTPRLVLMALGA
jgi:uncharacterized membrane protein SpoIIM required for sporulation